MQVQHVRDGVLLVRHCVPPDEQKQVFADLMGDAAHLTSLPLPVTQVVTQRWKSGDAPDTARVRCVRALSARIVARVYGEGGVWATLAEDGCSEDHQGRAHCACTDATPHLPRSTQLNCVDALAYKAGTAKGWHRDMNWLVALTIGNRVTMGFQRHDDDLDHVELDVPSGCAVIFNGALHRHAVLRITEGTAPSWFSETQPFSRAVFLMRDTRQSWKAMQKKLRRAAVAIEAGKAVAEIAGRRDGRWLPDWLQSVLRSDAEAPDYDENVTGVASPHLYHWRVTLVQGHTMKRMEEVVAIARAVVERHRPDYVVFSECSFGVALRNGDTSHLEPVLALTRELGIGIVLGTCPEMEPAQQFVTSLCCERGALVCRYRKRKATRTGAHAEGTEVGQWQSTVLAGCTCGVLICFDVENEQVSGFN